MKKINKRIISCILIISIVLSILSPNAAVGDSKLGLMYDIAYGNSTYVAVGQRTIMRSTDGVNWYDVYDDVKGYYLGVIWDGEKFIIVGSRSLILTSTDGEVWQKVNVGFNFVEMHGIAYSGNRYVAAGMSEIIYSDDGVVWSKVNSGLNFNLDWCNIRGLVWTGKQFIAYGCGQENEYSGYNMSIILVSEDGINWTMRYNDTEGCITSIAWDGEKYVAVGSAPDISKPVVCVSDNVLEWHLASTNDLELFKYESPECVIYTNNCFMVFGDDGVFSSEDGSNWKKVYSTNSKQIHQVIWDGVQYIAVTQNDIFGKIMVSDNCKNWTDCIPVSRIAFNRYIYYNGQKNNLDASPFELENEIMVPVRAIAEAMGASAQWDGNRQEIILISNNDKLIMKIGSSDCVFNEMKVTATKAPVIKEGRTMLPLKFIAEIFKCEVEIDYIKREISINRTPSSTQLTTPTPTATATATMYIPTITPKTPFKTSTPTATAVIITPKTTVTTTILPTTNLSTSIPVSSVPLTLPTPTPTPDITNTEEKYMNLVSTSVKDGQKDLGRCVRIDFNFDEVIESGSQYIGKILLEGGKAEILQTVVYSAPLKRFTVDLMLEYGCQYSLHITEGAFRSKDNKMNKQITLNLSTRENNGKFKGVFVERILPVDKSDKRINPSVYFDDLNLLPGDNFNKIKVSNGAKICDKSFLYSRRFLDLLIDPGKLKNVTVTIPEGAIKTKDGLINEEYTFVLEGTAGPDYLNIVSTIPQDGRSISISDNLVKIVFKGIGLKASHNFDKISISNDALIEYKQFDKFGSMLLLKLSRIQGNKKYKIDIPENAVVDENGAVNSRFLLDFSTYEGHCFKDVSPNHWANSAIEEMANSFILSGFPDRTFKPDSFVTREQFAKIMVLALKLDLTSSKMESFVDVSKNAWSYNYIETAKAYLTGYKNGNSYLYKPNEDTVREDIAVALVKALKLENMIVDLKELDSIFRDVNDISPNLKKYVLIAYKSKLIAGYDDKTFRAKSKLTRAEASMLLYRIIKNWTPEKVTF
ncbi:stalk domain-containing protein [Pseudobacteroides cellulosolvens]|uniref:Copper amine oxidase-like domain-containing protein n=1 Tax=Pseudobacteroides cellulosolvens ATCC 35603 = DSM 2933 TaxID=398512 RepID=A0A0L6JQC9_9FIRM|nr:stalk domain-containing protein [Pseudobacteroides cellulosolvens]KNY27895.1 copper amine oxidase-like domain-containing protein [Pseudobacteroides cellulosolvens ATCC 35603 = DSM 2933]